MSKARFMAQKYDGRQAMPGKAYVYDFEAGGIARDTNGRLLWLPTLAAAKRVASQLNAADRRRG